jgi:hypothetical protein
VAGLTTRDLVLASGQSAVRVVSGSVVVGDASRITHMFSDGQVFVRPGTSARIVGGVVGELFVQGEVTVTRARVLFDVRADDALFADSATFGALHVGIFGNARLFHSRVGGAGGTAVQSRGLLALVNTRLAPLPGAAAIDLCDDCAFARFSAHGLEIALPAGARLLDVDGAPTSTTAQQLRTCTNVPGCVVVEQLDVAAAPAAAAVDPFPLGAPASAVADDIGRCRPGFDGAFAIGPREP